MSRELSRGRDSGDFEKASSSGGSHSPSNLGEVVLNNFSGFSKRFGFPFGVKDSLAVMLGAFFVLSDLLCKHINKFVSVPITG